MNKPNRISKGEYSRDYNRHTGERIYFIHTNDMSLKSNGYTLEQEEAIYDRLLEDVIHNTRWYLDNLEFMRAYTVRWKRYPAQNKLKTVSNNAI